MKYNLFLIVFFLISSQVMGQVELELKTAPFEVKGQSFFIKQVTDERKAPHLGDVKDPDKNKVRLKLKGGASKAVQEFINASFPYAEGYEPIYVKIKALDVQESNRRMNNWIARIARAHVALTFFRQENGALIEVFSIQHNEDQVFYLSEREWLYETHEKRIRAALEYCMLSFLENYQKDAEDTEMAHFKKDESSSEFNSKLGNWFNIIMVKGMRSTYYEGFAISYNGFVDSKKGFIAPIELPFEFYSTRSNVIRDRGYESVDLMIFGPRLYFLYKKIFPGVYAALSLNVPIGYEALVDLNDDKSYNFIIGAGASQGIRIIPWEKSGLVIGADFTQRFQTSKVYRRDIGFELMLGINF